MVEKAKAAEAVTLDTRLDMWNRLEPTDPKYTKQFDKGGFKGTATNATYILKRLTEEFGPCGAGWRFVLDDEQVIEGHTLKNGDKAKLHIVRGHLDYRTAIITFNGGDAGGWLSTSPQFGQTMLVGENRHGSFTDEEAPKKSITDCISKCAVLLGIAADVHLGLFDDNKYVNQRKQEEALSVSTAPAPAVTNNSGAGAIVNGKMVPDGGSVVVPATEDDMTIARQVFSLVKSVCANAKDRREIDDSLKHNKAALAVLEKASPGNFASLKSLVGEAHKKLDDPMNDELPDFA